MKNAVLQELRTMASDLSRRERVPVDIELKSGTVLRAKYDPLFKTVNIAGATYPEKGIEPLDKALLGIGSSQDRKEIRKPCVNPGGELTCHAGGTA